LVTRRKRIRTDTTLFGGCIAVTRFTHRQSGVAAEMLLKGHGDLAKD
jgi:hypothetical protein